jgi:hypothetical protein
MKKVSCLRWETFFAQRCSQLYGQCYADEEEFETEVLKWLRQQSKDFYATGFDALVKLWDECINVGGVYVEKLMFFHIRISYVLGFITFFDIFTLPRIYL